MPKQMGGLLRTHLRPSNRHPTQQFMGPNQPAIAYPEFSTVAKNMDNDVPFSIGKELIVEIKVNPRGTHDIYIDDMIPLRVDIP
jgi:hypothetical protein